jgi:hypothetical protein
MNAVKSTYKDAPNLIPVPEEFQHKNIEVIFLPVEQNANQFLDSIPVATDEEMEEIKKMFGKAPDKNNDTAFTETIDL